MQIIGKPTIHPVLFFSGKIIGYSLWILLLLSTFGLIEIRKFEFLSVDQASYFLAALGLMISILSIVNLGHSTTLGLPIHKTTFKTDGLYRLSRNPMYIGFHLMTASSVLYHLNVFIALAGAYSGIIYHLIILSEERFLLQTFQNEYAEYQAKVRRYI